MFNIFPNGDDVPYLSLRILLYENKNKERVTVSAINIRIKVFCSFRSQIKNKEKQHIL